MARQAFAITTLIIALVLGAPRLVSPSPARPDAAQAGVDLTAEITLIPSVPDPGAVTTIRIVVRNRGASSASGFFFVYLYVDPATRPPQFNTPDTYFWQLSGLAAGGSYGLERTYTFTTTGCDHIVYAWVDRESRIGETDETNNLVSTPVCVGVTCQADNYEDDNSCSAAAWIGPEAIQRHTLCPVGDQDWIKFTATGGVTYTVAATNLGPHADPLVALYPSCSGLSQFGTGPRFDWYAPASGVYYAQVKNRTDTYGPLATYDLGITVASAPADVYEPDDSCATARDIRTDGVRQSHLFQAIGDHDWVKFSVGSGETFSVVADNTGPGVSPLIALYSSCDQAPAGPLAQGSQVQTAAGAGQTYYAKAVNQNAAVYGPAARYDLAVRTIPCVADAFEEDDTRTAAREIMPTGAVQTHNTCPAGDEDWVRFAA